MRFIVIDFTDDKCQYHSAAAVLDTRYGVNMTHWKLALLLITSFCLQGTTICLAKVENPADSAFREQILNGTACVPNLSDGYRPVHLNNGLWEGKEDDRSISVEIKKEQIAFGILDKKPVAVAAIADHGGGSGVFYSLLLYEMQAGRARTIGSYSAGDRTTIDSLTIAGNRVRLVATEFKESKPTTKLIKLSDFDKADCLDKPLSSSMKKDVDDLIHIYLSITPSSPELDPGQKLSALAICRRYQNSGAEFARALRLTLGAGGYKPGPQPLSFLPSGAPVLQVDDNISNFHTRVDLTSK